MFYCDIYGQFKRSMAILHNNGNHTHTHTNRSSIIDYVRSVSCNNNKKKIMLIIEMKMKKKTLQKKNFDRSIDCTCFFLRILDS